MPPKPRKPAPAPTAAEVPATTSPELPASHLPDKIAKELMQGPELPLFSRKDNGAPQSEAEKAQAALVQAARAKSRTTFTVLMVALASLGAVALGWVLVEGKKPQEVPEHLKEGFSMAARRLDGKEDPPSPEPSGTPGHDEPVPGEGPLASVGEVPDPAPGEAPPPGDIHEMKPLRPPGATGSEERPAPKVAVKTAPEPPAPTGTGPATVVFTGKKTTILLQADKILCTNLPCTLQFPAGSHALTAMVGINKVPVNLKLAAGQKVTRPIR